MSEASTHEYRDLAGLTGLLLAGLILFIVVAAVGAWFDWLAIDLLTRVRDGSSFTEAEAIASNSRQAIMGIFYLIVFILTGFVFLRWTVLANQNARALGADDMEFTPGWSAGWYFIPIVCLWKPYQALKEIFRASHPDHHEDWRRAPHPGLMPVWWLFWIVSTFVSQFVFRTAMRADSIDELLTSSWAILISDTMDVLLGLLALALVVTMYRWQGEKHQRRRHRYGAQDKGQRWGR